MSKDLEKENEKLEKQNKKLKKRSSAGGKIIIFLLLIIVILAALLFFLDPFGWGIGPNAKGGAGNADTAGAPAASQTEEADTEPAETEKPQAYTDVTVAGATYIFGTEETTIDYIVSIVKDSGEDVIVNIYDDSATQNAMEELIKRLESEGIRYTVK